MRSIRPRSRDAVSVLSFQIGCKHLQNQPFVDRGNRLVLEDWINIGLKRRRPLVGMLAILPAGLMGGDVGLRAFLEGDGPRRLIGPGLLLPEALLQRIEALEAHDPADLRLLACLDKRHGMKRAKAHIPQLAASAITENPALGIAGADLQIKPKPIGIHSRLQILLDFECAEHPYASHCKTSAS
jgi:hypothetical protein